MSKEQGLRVAGMRLTAIVAGRRQRGDYVVTAVTEAAQ